MTYQQMRVGAFICDGCECDFEDLGNKRFVWEQCQRRGWIERAGQHYCPDCAPRLDASGELSLTSEADQPAAST